MCTKKLRFFSVQNLVYFLTNKLKHGAVYQFLTQVDTSPTSPRALNPKKRHIEISSSSPLVLPEKRHEKHFLPLSLEAQLSCGNAKAPKPRAPVPPNHQPLPPEFHAATFDFSIPTSADDAPPDGESFSQETDLLLDFQNACDLPGRAPPPPPKDLGREGCAKGGDGRPESPPPCSSQGTRASQAVPTEEHGGEAR